jgi:ribosomal protein S18 acetylase RimI-like enzyme
LRQFRFLPHSVSKEDVPKWQRGDKTRHWYGLTRLHLGYGIWQNVNSNSGELVLIRNATRLDIPRIMEIRAGVRENKLRDPSRVTIEDVCWFVDNPGIFVWEAGGKIVGFSAADPRDGSIFALFVEEDYEGRGIGQASLSAPAACLLRPAPLACG